MRWFPVFLLTMTFMVLLLFCTCIHLFNRRVVTQNINMNALPRLGTPLGFGMLPSVESPGLSFACCVRTWPGPTTCSMPRYAGPYLLPATQGTGCSPKLGWSPGSRPAHPASTQQPAALQWVTPSPAPSGDSRALHRIPRVLILLRPRIPA